jgi:ankyrin repeat protein
LLEHGADANAQNFYTKVSAHQSALIAGQQAAADLLARFGATPLALEGKDAFAAACNRHDRDAAARLLSGHPEYLEHVDVLLDAAQRGDAAAVRIVLELGMDPNREGKHGHRALNQAACHRQVCELLWQHGADPGAPCFGGTPCGWAVHGGDFATARLHAEHSRLLLDAVASGHLALGAELLDEDPERIREASPAGQTALHGLPADLESAQALCELLLARGADPEARDSAGNTAAEHLDAQGLDAVADLIGALSEPP